MVPRPGVLELLKALETAGIPVLIVSAGLSDVIEEFLRQHGAPRGQTPPNLLGPSPNPNPSLSSAQPRP